MSRAGCLAGRGGGSKEFACSMPYTRWHFELRIMHAIAFRPVVNLIDEGKNEDNAGAGSGRADGRCDDRRVGRCDGAVGRQRQWRIGQGQRSRRGKRPGRPSAATTRPRPAVRARAASTPSTKRKRSPRRRPSDGPIVAAGVADQTATLSMSISSVPRREKMSQTARISASSRMLTMTRVMLHATSASPPSAPNEGRMSSLDMSSP